MDTSTPTVPSVVVDSSVFFAAAYPTTGTAHDLPQSAIHGQVTLVLSQNVIEETERNILKRAAHAHPAFLVFRDDLPYQRSDPAEALLSASPRRHPKRSSPASE